MNAPASDAARYTRFADRLVTRGIIADPWVDGEPRFADVARILPEAQAFALYSAAEALGAAWNEFTQVALAADDATLADRLGLSPLQVALARIDAPRWHGIARIDLFSLANSRDFELVTTEINADTPTGEAEATELGALAREDHPDRRYVDPNAVLLPRFLAAARRLAGEGANAAPVGIIYPTEFTEDLPLVRLYRRAFAAAGHPVILGSPFNLDGDDDGTLRLFGAPIALAIRHYKTDWWTERESAFDDEPIEDADPLTRELALVARAVEENKAAFVNPFASMLPQNKRSMAWFWEHLDHFSVETQATVRRYVPPTFRLEACDFDALRADKDDWVLKSDFGAEGGEVVVGREVSKELFAETLAHARPRRWVAQQAFRAAVDSDGLTTNFGVYLVAGRASGLYLRRQAGATDDRALSTGVLVDTGQGGE